MGEKDTVVHIFKHLPTNIQYDSLKLEEDETERS